MMVELRGKAYGMHYVCECLQILIRVKYAIHVFVCAFFPPLVYLIGYVRTICKVCVFLGV